MGKAVCCSRCFQDRGLKFKCLDEDSPDNLWWIVCDICGNRSGAKPTLAEAGEQWNREQVAPGDAYIDANAYEPQPESQPDELRKNFDEARRRLENTVDAVIERSIKRTKE